MALRLSAQASGSVLQLRDVFKGTLSPTCPALSSGWK